MFSKTFFLFEYQSTCLVNKIFNSCHSQRKSLMTIFWWHSIRKSYKITKNSLRIFIWMWKYIEFHLPHYKIPQLSSRKLLQEPLVFLYGHYNHRVPQIPIIWYLWSNHLTFDTYRCSCSRSRRLYAVNWPFSVTKVVDLFGKGKVNTGKPISSEHVDNQLNDFSKFHKNSFKSQILC